MSQEYYMYQYVGNKNEVPVPRSPCAPMMTMAFPPAPPLVPLTMWAPQWLGQNMAAPLVHSMVLCDGTQPAYVGYNQMDHGGAASSASQVPNTGIITPGEGSDNIRWPSGIVAHGAMTPDTTHQSFNDGTQMTSAPSAVIPGYMSPAPSSTFRFGAPAHCMPPTAVLLQAPIRHALPVPTNQIQEVLHQVPSAVGPRPTVTRQIPMVSGQITPMAGQISTPTGQISAPTGRMPALTRQMPAPNSHMSPVTNQMPALAGQIPTVTNQMPTLTNYMPAMTNQMQAATNQMSAYMPASLHKVPAQQTNIGSYEGSCLDLSVSVNEQLSHEFSQHITLETCSPHVSPGVSHLAGEHWDTQYSQEQLVQHNQYATKEQEATSFSSDLHGENCDSMSVMAIPCQNQVEANQNIRDASLNKVTGYSTGQGDEDLQLSLPDAPMPSNDAVPRLDRSSRSHRPGSVECDQPSASSWSRAESPWYFHHSPSPYSLKHCYSDSSFSTSSPESSLSRTRSESSLDHSWLPSPQSALEHSQSDSSSCQDMVYDPCCVHPHCQRGLVETGGVISPRSESRSDPDTVPDSTPSESTPSESTQCSDDPRLPPPADVHPDHCTSPVIPLEQHECADMRDSPPVPQPRTTHRRGQPRRTMYTSFCWPPIKVIIPERSTMTTELFAQIDRKVCHLYTQFTNHYQVWLKTKEDRGRPDVISDRASYLDTRIHVLERYLADFHVDLDSYVTFYEVQTSAPGCISCPLSTWQTRNITAVRHHLAELRKWQSESAHGLPLFDIRQQKLLELSQKEAALLTEILIPRLPADSPGNNTRCLTSLLANNLQPAKTAFIRKKIDALNKKAGKNAACPEQVMNIDVLHQRSQ